MQLGEQRPAPSLHLFQLLVWHKKACPVQPSVRPPAPSLHLFQLLARQQACPVQPRVQPPVPGIQSNAHTHAGRIDDQSSEQRVRQVQARVEQGQAYSCHCTLQE